MNTNTSISTQRFIVPKPIFVMLLILLYSAKSQYQGFTPESVYIYTFPQLSLPLSSHIQETDRATSLSFYLPPNYTPEKKYPLVLYIAGGQGGPGIVAWRGKQKMVAILPSLLTGEAISIQAILPTPLKKQSGSFSNKPVEVFLTKQVGNFPYWLGRRLMISNPTIRIDPSKDSEASQGP